ncbi:zinc ribbon domain-containing protein [Secundilactobacillus folii]|uniref:Zinc-ribbon domain-containing protein n=1 Tax=Secundilactobacillus folii TaxID=2678357 RepID=A0A7X3C3T4_9LACO|nr:zinc ribbon domain-containing protein [Secundilactobacillus folii]MTV82649.1 zinc-ribbon domain-containing protein [Secundilactobacillus folii]
MATIICPSCGHAIPANSTFCPDCGFALTAVNAKNQDQALRESSLSRKRRRSADSWQRRLIPNWQHLRQVGQFMLTNSWFLLVVYVVTLVLNDWRWEILGLFLLTCYLFPLLSGRTVFFGTGPLERKNETLPGGPKTGAQPVDTQFEREKQSVSRAAESVKVGRPTNKLRFHLMPNLEFRLGTILIIPSLIVYLVARQVITRNGGQTNQLFNRPGLGVTADVYVISLGLLGIAAALVLGGCVKGITHHHIGGQRFKRWALTAAILAILLAIGLYQNAGVAATSSSSVLTAIGNYLITFLPWAAVILYGVGIIKNLITPQRW